MKIRPKRLFSLHLIVFVVITTGLLVTPVRAQGSCEAEVCFNESSNQPLPDAKTEPLNAGVEVNAEPQISTETYTEAQRLLADGITADLKARRLMRPKGNNALQKVRELRVLLPTHDYSVNGERYIARVYMVLGRAAIKSGNPVIAQQRLNSAVKLDKRVKGQQALQVAIAAAGGAADTKSTDQSKQVIANYADTSKKVKDKPVTEENDSAIAFVAPVMVAIPAGKFVMGSEAGAEDEKPMREVSIQAFSMSKHEITMEQYRVYAIDNDMLPPQYEADDQNRPVTNVSWQDAQAYVQWLSMRTKKQYRLPTEAQWEYAARAGTVTPFYTGEDLLTAANCVGCGGEWAGKQTAPVGSFQPNPFGLYDMHGNVWEWVQDCWTDNYFGRGDNAAAITRKGCDRYVMRGGSWYNESDYARVSYRGNEVPEFRDKGVGFRVVHDGL